MTNQAYIPSGGLAGKLVRLNARLRIRRPLTFALDHPIVSITFDDFPRSAVTYGRAALGRRGWHGTWYAAAGFIGTDTHHGAMMTHVDVGALADAGHEIACHTHSHTDAARTPVDTLLADIDRNADVLNAAVPGSTLENFAFPYGESSPAAKSALQSRFETLRGVRPGVNRTGDDLNLLKAVGIDGGQDGMDRVLDWIADARKKPGWLILYVHDIQDQPTDWGCTPREFEMVLEAVSRSGADVMTVRDAAKAIRA
ncbi:MULTISPECIES: polysaccharide deacetylase family protein [Hyphobacterium]|uniref:Chitooligosaccharide deacetylase n=1 Tax=Hyphobacterium vulgare TaxID=1736751 RepID=A0ABV6ZTN4_9PROT